MKSVLIGRVSHVGFDFPRASLRCFFEDAVLFSEQGEAVIETELKDFSVYISTQGTDHRDGFLTGDRVRISFAENTFNSNTFSTLESFPRLKGIYGEELRYIKPSPDL